MKYRYILILFFLVGSGILSAQNLEFYFGSGIGNSNLTDLKKIQEIRITSFNVPSKLTENFPARYYFMGEARYKISRISYGMYYSYSSTGSRCSYRDYSGAVNMDIISSSNYIAPLISFSVFNSEKCNLDLSLRTPFIFSKVSFTDYLEVYGDVFTDTLTVYSNSFAFNPGIEISYKYSILKFGLRAGYLLDTKGFLHQQGDKERYLEIKYNKVYTNWSGYRFEILAGISILSKPIKPIHLFKWIIKNNSRYYRIEKFYL